MLGVHGEVLLLEELQVFLMKTLEEQFTALAYCFW